MMSVFAYSWQNLGIECIASNQLPIKRLGYLLVANVTIPQDPIRMMVVNSMLGDLKVGDYTQVQCALHGVSHVLTKETVPIFIRIIMDLLASKSPPVKRLALCAMQKAFTEGTTLEKGEIAKVVLSMVCDRDPSVMAASLPLALKLITEDTKIFHNSNFTSILVYILKQIFDGKLSPSFTFHTIPAPWTKVIFKCRPSIHHNAFGRFVYSRYSN